MKILIIANMSIVFGKELKNELEKAGEDVTLLDFEHLHLSIGNRMDDCLAKKFSRWKWIPKLTMFFRMAYIRQLLREEDFDVVNIHYNRWYYRLLTDYFVRSRTKLVISTYGSDFYRASEKNRRWMRPIYAVADRITFTNEMTKRAFVEHYKDFRQKSRVCRFGLKTLDYIKKNRLADRMAMRRRLGYDPHKIVVTCGYNATAAQRHFHIIDAILAMDERLRDRCQFIFPMTYGNLAYKRTVIDHLESLSFDFVILEEFLYDDDNAYVKLASDIMINILETDSFSGSMQEFLYAGNIVVTGSWLPYETFDKAGIEYLKIDSIDDLKEKMEYAIEHLKMLRQKAQANRVPIENLSSWENCIRCWKSVFRECLH